MRIAIGCDHRGIEVKNWVAEVLHRINMKVDDCGTNSTDSCDYPDIAAKVANQVATGAADQGVLICGSGIGVSIAANKIAGIRAALCVDPSNARLARQHNNANVLCLAANNATADSVAPIVTAFVETEFEGGRHARRVDKINELDGVSASNQN